VNWDALATIAELIGAIGVIASLIYVARQVKSSQATAADTNRLSRSGRIADMIHTFAADDALRNSVIKSYRLEDDYKKMAAALDISFDDAARTDFVNAYWFWVHWGQYCSTIDPDDIEELKISIGAYAEMPAINYSWENSFLAKRILDRRYVAFAEKTLVEHAAKKDRASGG
jgi:hypothetical protein